jgi:hypothetical protein
MPDHPGKAGHNGEDEDGRHESRPDGGSGFNVPLSRQPHRQPVLRVTIAGLSTTVEFGPALRVVPKSPYRDNGRACHCGQHAQQAGGQKTQRPEAVRPREYRRTSRRCRHQDEPDQQ